MYRAKDVCVPKKMYTGDYICNSKKVVFTHYSE